MLKKLKKQVDPFILSSRYVKSVYLRVLPNIPYNFKDFRNLFNNKDILSYYKSTRKLNEYPGLYDFFKSRGFDMSTCDIIRNSTNLTRSKFLESVTDFIDSTTSRDEKSCNITEDEIHFLRERFHLLIPLQAKFVFPSLEDLVSSINKSASIGLPNPFIKKRDMLDVISKTYTRVMSEDLRPSDVFRYPAAAFLRLQIKTSGLKFRLVQAVEVCQQAIESIYLLYFKSGFEQHKLDSHMILGFTQLEVSELLQRYKGYWWYSLDGSKFDANRKQEVSITSFGLLEERASFNRYHTKIFRQCRNNYLTLPLFHPKCLLLAKTKGTVSGSSFTSLDNSVCNWIMSKLVLRWYFIKIDSISLLDTVIVLVSGDDLLILSPIRLDINHVINKLENRFGIVYKLEMESAPSQEVCMFLGSKWINGVPFRNEAHMVASVVFGSGNFPKMTRDELLQSRFLEVFGNSGDCFKYWKRLGYKTILKRLFFFSELSSPFRFDTSRRISRLHYGTPKDRRGFWFSSHETSMLNELWQFR
jgi:hypothetical protein